MAAHKFLKNNAGVITEEAAVETSAGAGDEGKHVALNASGVLDSTIVNSKTSSAGAGDAGKLPALDGTGKLDSTFMPTGVGADTVSITASENLADGDFVNIWVSTGTKVRKADATVTGKFAHGFVLGAVTSGNPATVYLSGQNTHCTGLTVGDQFLATTAGLPTATAPSGSGNVVQRIGVAVSSTALDFTRCTPIVLA